MLNKLSTEDLKNIIFREYEKKSDKFIATNKFFISDEVDNGKIEFSAFDINLLYQKNHTYEKFTQFNKNGNIYVSNNNNFSKKYIELRIR